MFHKKYKSKNKITAGAITWNNLVHYFSVVQSKLRNILFKD